VASLSFDRSEFYLAPGASIKITATVTPPTGLDPASFPVYSGWVTITANNGEILVVPYMGLAANLIDMDILDRSDYYFGFPTPAVLDAAGDVQTVPTNYTFADGDFPSFLWRQAAGSPRVSLNLVESTANTTQAPAIGAIIDWEYTMRSSANGVRMFSCNSDCI
jgi:Fn3-like domain